ncbi:bifunctional riboflavin kinase/FAD synthetase [Stackebrandtia nassauensis]|nr:bifunctional riboflavin kinase/FAD synthetase [Stackebrandtia nassauensis]
MQRWRGIDATPGSWGRSVVTIGVFDGVHRGHQHVIGRAVATAREAGVSSVVVTFDPHPSEVVRPGTHPAVLTELDRRGDLIAELGADGLCVLPFTRELSQLSPRDFARDMLAGGLGAQHVVVGENFRFGHKAAGDTGTLAELGTEFGFTVEAVKPVGESATVFSSTFVRSRLTDGDVEAAAEALGRPHRLSGMVVRGANRGGTQLGFPTANLRHAEHAAIPADAVYAGWLTWAGSPEPLAAAISVGTNPTFHGTGRTVEAHILDFDTDIYGEPVSLDFVARLREQRTYDALPALIAQIDADVIDTRKVLGL